jgi:hypothetical protein
MLLMGVDYHPSFQAVAFFEEKKRPGSAVNGSCTTARARPRDYETSRDRRCRASETNTAPGSEGRSHSKKI